MASERNRSLKLIELLNSKNIEVNIGKNKARGNNGVFILKNNNYRIDISKTIEEKEKISVIIHEYAHYVHAKYDKSMNSLDFIFNDLSIDEQEELLNITVEKIPEEFAKKICKKRQLLKDEIKKIKNKFLSQNLDINIIEKNLPKLSKLLIKHDAIQYYKKIYNINNISLIHPELKQYEFDFLILCSKQRQLKRINSRINRLNNYYNKPSELFARVIETFFIDNNTCLKFAPKISQRLKNILNKNCIPELNEIYDIFK